MSDQFSAMLLLIVLGCILFAILDGLVRWTKK